MLSIDLYVADAATGKVVRKLTSTASDPHFSSLQFIYSAGAWDAASQRIAIATVTSGRPALAIFNAQSGDKEREVPLSEVDEIFNPTWSPDGHAMCFTGMSAGLTDLFIYDLEASKLRRLTHDAFADLQPAWSPDGTRIAFATDRFSSDLSTLAIGSYRLALIDPASGDIEAVRVFTSGKNINPQWTPDSRALLFISDRDGVPNVYRVAIGTGDGTALTQITRVRTGISGITGSSPALSVATKSGTAAFSLYDGRPVRHLRHSSPATAPVGRALSEPAASAAMLPPLDRQAERRAGPPREPDPRAAAGHGDPPSERAVQVDADARSGRTTRRRRRRRPVRPGGLGGIGFQFGDMLGNHSLTTVVQLNSGLTNNFSLKNTAAQVLYFNQARRWNWGVVASQVPYLSGGFQSAARHGRRRAGADRSDDHLPADRAERRGHRRLSVQPLAARRVPGRADAGCRSIRSSKRTAYSLRTGQLLGRGLHHDVARRAADAGHDVGGAGVRHVDLRPDQPGAGTTLSARSLADLRFAQLHGVLADYRRYFMPAPFYTLATRVLHYGRYGAGRRATSGCSRCSSAIRTSCAATTSGRSRPHDCLPNAVSECPAFDRLIGSRMLVGNLEFRFPLLRPFGASQGMYGPIPVEVALFADGGVAWNRREKPSFLGGTQEGVASAGVAFRVNLFGFAVAEFDFVRPFQRAGARAGSFQFNLAPGF